MRRVMFVDDERDILDGLQNVLRRQRKVWDMQFMNSGEAALYSMEQEPVDVIVSDMRMPNMDGPALLAEVKRRHPTVIRIVLSGHAERDAIMRALPVSHQYLTKPCDTELLKSVVDRACDLRTLLADAALLATAGGIDTLPVLPSSFAALTAALNDPNSNGAAIARLIETDPAVSAKILQLANSTLFGARQRITSLTQSVAMLGVDLVKSLVLASHAFASFDGSAHLIEGVQRHSIAVAQKARQMCSDPKLADDVFCAALLHDVGILALKAHRAEHGLVGAYLLGMWGLPFPIVEAVAYLHDTTKAGESSPVLAKLRAAHTAVHDEHDA